jgi:hypothetical protein
MDNSGDDEKPPIADWVHLPPSATELSLWEILHDGLLTHATLDRLDRSLQLEFDIRHIREFHHLPEGTRFLLKLSRVQSIRAIYEVTWPGEFSLPDGASREHASELIREYHDKSIEEAVPWAVFSERLDREPGGAEVFEASLVEAAGRSVALRMFLHVNDDFYPELTVRAQELKISLSTHETLTLAHFLHFGESYWDDFAERGRMRRAAAEASEQAT